MLKAANQFRICLSRSYAAYPRIIPSIDFSISNMKRAVYKQPDGTDRFTFSFYLKNDELKIDRQFNMSRTVDEKVGSFVDRLSANVEKIVNKNLKKRKKNSDDENGMSLTHCIIERLFVCLNVFWIDDRR